MKTNDSWLKRQLAVSLILLLAVPIADAATPTQQQSSNGQQQLVPARQSKPDSADPTSPEPQPAADPAQPAYPDNPAPVQQQQPAKPAQSQQPDLDQQQQPASNPVGTAAAPYEKPTGVAASRPAGAVIAPAKQKRARIILIRTAIVIGAAVSIGTVVALSKGSPSRPN